MKTQAVCNTKPSLLLGKGMPASVCVSVGRGHVECEFLHGDKRWPMPGREAAKKRHREGNRGGSRLKAVHADVSISICQRNVTFKVKSSFSAAITEIQTFQQKKPQSHVFLTFSACNLKCAADISTLCTKRLLIKIKSSAVHKI